MLFWTPPAEAGLLFSTSQQMGFLLLLFFCCLLYCFRISQSLKSKGEICRLWPWFIFLVFDIYVFLALALLILHWSCRLFQDFLPSPPLKVFARLVHILSACINILSSIGNGSTNCCGEDTTTFVMNVVLPLTHLFSDTTMSTQSSRLLLLCRSEQ